jgi:uncharacterized iron-regulated protein
MGAYGGGRRDFLLRGGLAALAMLGAASCASLLGPRMLLTEHPLVGRVWDGRDRAFVDADAAIADWRRAAVVLLGESHDNPDHHRVQLRVLDALSMAGARHALVMEQFDVEHQTAIDDALRQSGVNADDIARAGKLDRTGWDWPLYRPLIERALERGMPIAAANLSRAAARRIVMSGFGALGEQAGRLPLDETWSDERDAILSNLIGAGHCGQAPEEMVRGIVRAQRARDATMAQAMSRYPGRGVIGIVGRGHARRDIGIPVYLAALSPGASVSVVGLVEVAEGQTDPAAYAVEEGAGAYDWLWFTARAERPDPCAGLRFDKQRASPAS